MSIERKDIATTAKTVRASKDSDAVTYAAPSPANIAECAALCADGEAGVVREFTANFVISLNGAQRRAMKDADAKDHKKLAQSIAGSYVSAPRGSGTGTTRAVKRDASEKSTADRKKLAGVADILADMGVTIVGLD